MEEAKNNNNPLELLKQITKDYSPEQINMLFEKAKQFGVPESVIEQAQSDLK